MSDNIQNNTLFWSPSVKWNKTEDQINIAVFKYNSPFADLFPDFYFLTQDGISEAQLNSSFDNIDSEKLKIFIEDLKKKHILIDTILSPQEIFYPQNFLLNHNYGNSLIINKEASETFKQNQLSRTCVEENETAINLITQDKLPDFIAERKTYRNFDTSRKISFSDFSYLTQALGQIKDSDKVRYLYASAGGLYPIDTYIFIKEERVEGIDKGLYYFNPVKNQLITVNNNCDINANAHYYINKEIYNESAFSLFFFYNGEVSMPKYGGMGYYYALIDLGILAGTLTTLAELKKMGVCSIGDMDFRKIEDLFKLSKTQKYLHTIEVGLK